MLVVAVEDQGIQDHLLLKVQLEQVEQVEAEQEMGFHPQ
tara:strand:- start:125 stop:241 length:117 start_codon:yes stop_codon:yes gene_type:complete